MFLPRLFSYDVIIIIIGTRVWTSRAYENYSFMAGTNKLKWRLGSCSFFCSVFFCYHLLYLVLLVSVWWWNSLFTSIHRHCYGRSEHEKDTFSLIWDMMRSRCIFLVVAGWEGGYLHCTFRQGVGRDKKPWQYHKLFKALNMRGYLSN